jgi:hypothetical protein
VYYLDVFLDLSRLRDSNCYPYVRSYWILSLRAKNPFRVFNESTENLPIHLPIPLSHSSCAPFLRPLRLHKAATPNVSPPVYPLVPTHPPSTHHRPSGASIIIISSSSSIRLHHVDMSVQLLARVWLLSSGIIVMMVMTMMVWN